jgi:hypothetical protein
LVKRQSRVRGRPPRIEKRIEALNGIHLAGYDLVISKLEVERNYLLRAKRYVEQEAR